MSLFDAKSAKKATAAYKVTNLNYQREVILKAIEVAASRGNMLLIVDEPLYRIRFDEDDWQFFKSLGYSVSIPVRYVVNDGNVVRHHYSFGKISWEQG